LPFKSPVILPTEKSITIAIEPDNLKFVSKSLMRRILFACLFLVVSLSYVNAQELLSSFDVRNNLAKTSLLKDYPVRNIGPTVQGGRIVDIEVNLKNTKEFYVGFASGGIFRTVSNGISFQPVFDNVDALGIGDFALSQSDINIMYVGTGEKNGSRSSYAGSGLYKTIDGAKTWQRAGLATTQHISRVIIHPQNNNVVWVAAIGALYTSSPERGVFKTVDGGKTWKKTLFINDSTGVIDLIVNPKNPDELIASAWERSRKAWSFKGNGENSAIYRSIDGGETWTKSMTGFAIGKTVGRIGLKYAASDPRIVYAILDNQKEVEDKKKKKESDKLKIENFRTMSKEDFLKLENTKLDEFLKENGFPKKYSAEGIKKDIKEGKYTVKSIGDYYGADANQKLFDTKVTGAEVYRSNDGGASWNKVNSYDLDGVFYTYGYYFSEMEVSPKNADVIYIYGVPLLKSRDGGKTWHRLDTLNGVRDIHVDHHVVWSDPNDPDHLLLGNDGGLYQSYDEGANWIHINNMPVGQFYMVNVDMETPYNVYGGLQDNGVLRGSSTSVPNESKHWEMIFGGDGMYVAPDPRNSKLVYTGFQFGNYYRLDLDKNKSTKITPQHDIGEQPLRWNWRTPLFISKHNADIIYTASNKVHRSLNKGESWEVISPDLTKNKKQGNVPFSSISTLAESPIKFGLLYAGTDDGNLWITKDNGASWSLIVAGLPENKWISSICSSPHEEGTVFISMNGYRDDDFKTYLFVSTDFGKTWKSIKGNLPEAVANVVLQDPVNPDLLYCGLDNGTYASLDKGTNWHLFNQFLNVPSYDMIVHPRENELVIGTHGRSVFVADVKPLQALKDGVVSKGIFVVAPETVQFSDSWGEKSFEWDKANEPKCEIFYYVGKAAPSVTVQVLDEKNNLVHTSATNGTQGFHTYKWNLMGAVPATSKGKSTTNASTEAKYIGKGKYKIKMINGTESAEVMLEVK
jgi:photosystem II stability/assembly factor-like uncharacterized protein